MRRTNITFFVFFVSITTLGTLTVANAKWSVIREDDIIRNDGIQGMLHDVHFMDKQHGLVVGENGLVLETADGGKTWTKKEINMRPPGAAQAQRRPQGAPGFGGGGAATLYNIYFVDEKVGFLTGARGTILKTDDGGKTWARKMARSEAAANQNNPRRRGGGIRSSLMGIQMIDEKNGFIVGTENAILKTTDGGETWIGRSERVRVGETRNNLENILFVSPKTGWIIGSFGTLLHTKDSGETWEKRDPGFDNNLFGIHFHDEKTGWICGQEGLILHTDNGGETWKQQKTNSIDNLLDIHFVDNRVGWAVGDFSAVLHTTDGGKTWTATKAGGSGTLKGVHATDKDNCWTVDDWGVIAAYKPED